MTDQFSLSSGRVHRPCLWAKAFLCLVLLASGCASQQGNLRRLALEEQARFEIGRVDSRITGDFEFDAAVLFRESLEGALEKRNMKWAGGRGFQRYMIDMEILDYRPGSAFKRWLLPGWGSTVLAVRGEIRNPVSGESAGQIEYKRSVFAGGFYTTGAWKSIFDETAAEIARDLLKRKEKEGFIITLDPWAMREMEIPEASTRRRFNVLGFEDKREDWFRIGVRQAAFGAKMSDIFLSRDVSDLFREAIVDELRAEGHEIVSAQEDDALAVEGKILDFWVKTPATVLYWDVSADKAVEFTIEAFGETMEPFKKSYTCSSKKRTYLWPTNKLITGVLDSCFVEVLENFRNDRTAWEKREQR